MIFINRYSDFEFLLEPTVPLGGGDYPASMFDLYDWELRITSGSERWRGVYFASSKGGKRHHCRANDAGSVFVIMENHSLAPGRLWGELRVLFPDANYAKGYRLLVSRFPLDIELVERDEMPPIGLTVRTFLPVQFVSSYDAAVAAGYGGTREEYDKLLAELPQNAESCARAYAEVASLKEEVQGRITAITAEVTETTDRMLADMNGMVATLTDEVAGLKTRLDDDDTSDDSLSAEVTALSGRMDAAEADIATLGQQLTALRQSVELLCDSLAEEVQRAVADGLAATLPAALAPYARIEDVNANIVTPISDFMRISGLKPLSEPADGDGDGTPDDPSDGSDNPDSGNGDNNGSSGSGSNGSSSSGCAADCPCGCHTQTE